MMAPPLQPLLDPVLHTGERGRQRGGIGSACLGHVGPSTALPTDLGRDVVDEVAGLNLRNQIRGHAGDERYLAALGRAEDDRRGLELGLELVERVPQRLGVGTVDLCGEHAGAVDLYRLRRQIAPATGRKLSFHSSELLFERPAAIEELLNLSADFGGRGGFIRLGPLSYCLSF